MMGKGSTIANLIQAYNASKIPGDTPPIEKLRQHISNSMLLHADNVAQLVADKDFMWSWADIPCLRMPFPKLWIEYSLPGFQLNVHKAKSCNAGTKPWYCTDATVNRFACLVTEIPEGSKSYSPILGDMGDYRVVTYTLLPGAEKVSQDEKLHTGIAEVFSLEGGHTIHPGMCAYAFKSTNLGIPVAFFTLVDELYAAKFVKDNKTADNKIIIESPVAIALQAICLMNCKNTQISAAELPPTFRNRKERRQYLKFHVLKIQPMGHKNPRNRSESIEDEYSLHICRGHFKDYREKGLFGLGSHKGVYWWSPYVRGSEKVGVVEKDYAL